MSDDDLPPGLRIVARTPLTGGFRNTTELLVTDTGQRYVLRRSPAPDAGTAAVRAIEAALAELVRGVVPVPGVVAVRGDTMVTEFMPGEPADRVADVDPHGLGFAFGETLAALGTIHFAGPGFFTGPDLVPDGSPVFAGLAGFVEARVAGVLTADETNRLVTHAGAMQPVLDSLGETSRLVHADYNPKNLMVARRAGRWTVTAVLDWEFALSAHPLVDVGNMLRFRHERPPEFTDGFVAGYLDRGGELPDGWRAVADAVDLFALADLLSRGPAHPLFHRVIAVMRARIDTLSRTQ